jgi:hypothetical protein
LASVLVVNRPPIVTLSPSTQSVVRNQNFSVIADGIDPDGDVLTYRFRVGGGPWTSSPASFSGAASALGAYTVTVEASDGLGGTALASAQVLVGNQPPTVTLLPSPAKGFVGQPFIFTATGQDPEGDSLSYQFTSGGSVGAWGNATTFPWVADILGNKTVSVRVRDAHGLESDLVSATVLVENRAPVVSLTSYVGGVEQASGFRGTNFRFVAAGSDPDGDTSLSYLFEGRSWGSSQELFSSWAGVGNYTVKVWARDRHGLQSPPAVATVQVVNRPPTVTLSPSTQSVVRNQSFSVTAAGSDPDGDPLTYRFRVGSGPWASSPPTFSSSLSALGNYTVTVEASDGLGGTHQASAQVVVVNRPPTVTLSPSTQSIFPGQSFSVTAAGSDPDGDPLTYRFRVGSGPWASSPPTFSSSLSALGNYTVTVEASDGLGGIDQDSATVRVRDNNSRVTVVASPSAWGIPSGSGVYSRGSTATASVSPNYGYEFSSWEGISGQGTPYSFVVSDDVTLTGVLVPKLFRVKLETVAIVGGGTAANSYGLHADVTAYVYTSSGRLLGTVSSSATNRGNDASDLDVGEIYAPYGETIYVDAKVNVSSAMSLLALWNPGTRAQAQDGEDYSALNPDPNMARAQYYQERWSAWGSDSWSGTNLLSMVVGDWDGQYLGMVGAGTPLLVDLSGDGRPDLLGGGDWRLTPSRRPSADPSVYRRVNLGGAEADLWEWVGPSDGLLVYLPGLSGTPGASHLFGTQTFGKSWGHGFEPLATLDLNGDGVLRGAELDEVGVWVDANSDAQAQEGEIRKAQDVGLTQVSLEFVRDEFGNVSVEGGAELRGSQVSVWDWISYRYPKTTPENEVARWDWVNVPPSLEKFPVEVGEGLKKLEMSGGGTLRLHRIGGQLYMRATSAYSGVESPVVDFLFPARVVSPGVLEWGAGPVRNTLFASGLEFYGLTLAGADRYGVWSAKLLSGDLAGLFSPSSGD